MTAPAAMRRSTSTALSAAMLSRHGGLPQVEGSPATLKDSLTVIGTPCSGPHSSPRASAASAARARSRALSTCQLPGDDGVQRRVVLLGASDKEVEQLEAADAPVADLAGQAGCRGEGTLIHVSF